ncbi:cytochrome c family protein, partial [bacterium]|nr:cytochrome c family protein [bacterium]
TAAANITAGPVECGECHQQEPNVISGLKLIDFDASIHQRHITAADNKCESCHHGYNAVEKKIIYEKGKEDSCKTCHKEKLADNAISYKSASHQQCISCHQQEKGKKEFKNALVAGSKCSGCHDDTELEKIAKLDKIPRLDRNQPNTTFLKPFDDIMTREIMDPVIFNHQQHEDNGTSCSTCHHETLNSCESCHTFSGSKEGNWVTLAQAMHNMNSDRSCVGCHTKEQKAKDCVGCHSLMNKGKHISGKQSCQSCHTVPIDRLKADTRAGRKLLAKNYETKPVGQTRIDYKKVPEEVVISLISEEYKAVHFPHRIIIETLMNKIEDNVLAARFHQGKDVVCESCHHNSPGITNPPPKCISCHASSENEQDGGVPGIKAAYHRQCFECHEKMEIKKPVSTDCTACHKEK